MFTRQILEHERELLPFPQISVHLDTMAWIGLSDCSPPCPSGAAEPGASVFQGAGPGCSAVVC